MTDLGIGMASAVSIEIGRDWDSHREQDMFLIPCDKTAYGILWELYCFLLVLLCALRFCLKILLEVAASR